MGRGAYNVSGNSLVTSNVNPSFRTGGDGVVLAHREFIANITSSVAFRNTSYPLNPGMRQTFPWLHDLAKNFEEYEMIGCVFEYNPTSGVAISGTNPALGVVVMATDYDAHNPSFATKQQMESYEFSTATAPSKQALHPVECAPRRNVLQSLYVRQQSESPPEPADLRFYDMGNFQIATEGQLADGNTLGELWVTYHVRFRKPRIAAYVETEYARAYSTPDNSCTTAVPLGSSLMIAPHPATYFTQTAANNIVIPVVGSYLILIFGNSTSAMSGSYSHTYGTNITTGPRCL